MSQNQKIDSRKSTSIIFVLIGLVIIGIVFICLFFTLSFSALIYTDWSGNSTFIQWNRIAAFSFPLTILFSYYFFSKRRVGRKKLFFIHLLITVILYSSLSLISFSVYREQQSIVKRHQQFVESIRNRDFGETQNYISPIYLVSHSTDEFLDEFWISKLLQSDSNLSHHTVHVSGGQAYI